MTRTFLIIPAVALTLAACTPADQSLAIGTVGGAAVGAALSSGDDRAKGAIVGAVVGATAATLLGPAQTAGNCRYRDQNGNEYIAAC